MGARVLAVAAAHARILARRRTALLLLALLPLAFYGALYRHSPHAITTAGVLSAFSAGGAGIFSMLPARAADQRLALAGYQLAALILGRLLVLELAALGISAVTSAVMIAGSRPAHPGEVLAGVMLTGVVAVPLGLALGALLPHELEAVLVLIGIVGIQVTTQPDTVISKLLPFRAAVQLLDAATSTPVTLWPRLVTCIGYGAALLVITWAAWRRRATARPVGSPPSPARAADGRRRGEDSSCGTAGRAAADGGRSGAARHLPGAADASGGRRVPARPRAADPHNRSALPLR